MGMKDEVKLDDKLSPRKAAATAGKYSLILIGGALLFFLYLLGAMISFFSNP